MRKRRMLFAGFVALMGEERLPQRVMFGQFLGGEAYTGGQEKDWIDHLKEDMSAFGMKFEGLRKTAQKVDRWFRRVEEEPSCSCGIGMKRTDAKLQSDAQGLRQRHPPSASLAAGGGQETEIWVWPSSS